MTVCWTRVLSVVFFLFVVSVAGEPQAMAQIPKAPRPAVTSVPDMFIFPKLGARPSNFDDMSPIMPMSFLTKFGITEDWWYQASLRGSNGREYIVRFSFGHSGTSEGSIRFSELVPADKELGNPDLHCDFSGERSETDISAQTIRFHHAGIGCEIETLISQANLTTIRATIGQSHLELNFRSRGFPIPFDPLVASQPGSFASGFEDLSDVTGTATMQGTNVSLSGRGTKEHFRFSLATLSVGNGDKQPTNLNNDWFIINTDSIYMLVNRSRDNHNVISYGAGIMVDNLFETAKDKAVSIDMDTTSNAWPKWVNIKIQTQFGSYDLKGTLAGKADQYPLGPGYIHYPIYTFTGTMTHYGATTQLTNGSGWLEMRRYTPGPF